MTRDLKNLLKKINGNPEMKYSDLGRSERSAFTVLHNREWVRVYPCPRGVVDSWGGSHHDDDAIRITAAGIEQLKFNWAKSAAIAAWIIIPVTIFAPAVAEWAIALVVWLDKKCSILIKFLQW